MGKPVRREANPIDVVEAAYEVDRDEKDWLYNVSKQVRPLVDGGNGIWAYTFDLAIPTSWFDNVVRHGMSRFELETIVAAMPAIEQRGIKNPMHLDPEAFGTMWETARRVGVDGALAEPRLAATFASLGIRDTIQLRTIEPGGRGIVIVGGHSREARVDRRAKKLWARVAAHIAAGRRLRAAIARSDENVDVVLTPSGKIDDARGEGTTRSARETLREAVVRQEHARGRGRKTEPERATEAWTALVSGRWSLVDRFERGGRRFIVARRNQHELADPRALSDRERAVAHLVALGKSNKLVAYELGLGESTIATHLSSAMHKLGATSRVELVRLISALGRA